MDARALDLSPWHRLYKTALFSGRRLLVSRALHPQITSDAHRDRKLIAVNEVESNLFIPCNLLNGTFDRMLSDFHGAPESDCQAIYLFRPSLSAMPRTCSIGSPVILTTKSADAPSIRALSAISSSLLFTADVISSFTVSTKLASLR